MITSNRNDVKSALAREYRTSLSGRLATALGFDSSVFVANDDERDLHADYEHWLEELAPTHRPANTNTTAPARHVLRNNADAHLTQAAEGVRTLQIMGRDAQRWLRSARAVWTLARGSESSWGVCGDRRERRKRVLAKIIGE